MIKTTSGFTLVELLIVIVVIAILAAISVVAYNGVQDRATTSSLDSSLNQVSKKLQLHKINNDSYPSSLADVGVASSETIEYDYSTSNGAFCLSALTSDISRVATSINNSPAQGDCKLALVKWTTTGGVSFDATQNQLALSSTQSGSSVSPLAHNDGAATATLSAEVYVTKPSPANSPQGSNYYGSSYFAADGTTNIENTSGHKNNGHAGCDLTLNQWTTCNWTTATGPNVEWVLFRIMASPTQYTSDNIYRNVRVTVNK